MDGNVTKGGSFLNNNDAIYISEQINHDNVNKNIQQNNQKQKEQHQFHQNNIFKHELQLTKNANSNIMNNIINEINDEQKDLQSIKKENNETPFDKQLNYQINALQNVSYFLDNPL